MQAGELARAYSKIAPALNTASCVTANNAFAFDTDMIISTDGNARRDSAQSSPNRASRMSDQFECDMDFGETLEQTDFSTQNFLGHGIDTDHVEEEEEEEEDTDGKNGGKMSRSPSSIILFEQGQVTSA